MKKQPIAISIIIIGAIVALGILLGEKPRNTKVNEVGKEENTRSIQEFLSNNIKSDNTDLMKIAESFDIDTGKLDTCITEDQVGDSVVEDIKDGQNAGAKGTPYMVVRTSEGKTVSLGGVLPYEQMKEVVRILKEEPDTISDEYIDIRIPDETDNYFGGDVNSEITIIEFSDIDCPFCKQLHPTLKQISSEDEDVVWIYRHFPLPSLHPDAYRKALATECVFKEHGNDIFWQYLNAIIS